MFVPSSSSFPRGKRGIFRNCLWERGGGGDKAHSHIGMNDFLPPISRIGDEGRRRSPRKMRLERKGKNIIRRKRPHSSFGYEISLRWSWQTLGKEERRPSPLEEANNVLPPPPNEYALKCLQRGGWNGSYRVVRAFSQVSPCFESKHRFPTEKTSIFPHEKNGAFLIRRPPIMCCGIKVGGTSLPPPPLLSPLVPREFLLSGGLIGQLWKEKGGRKGVIENVGPGIARGKAFTMRSTTFFGFRIHPTKSDPSIFNLGRRRQILPLIHQTIHFPAAEMQGIEKNV